MRRTLAWLVLGLLVGCSEPPPSPSFLALGDSYTAGTSVYPADRWPTRLAAELGRGGSDVGEPQLVAGDGWRTDELSAAMDAAELRPPYRLVTLMIGVNDQYGGRPVAEFPPRVGALLDRAIALTGGDPSRVVAISIPDWGVTPFGEGWHPDAIAADVDAYNAAFAEASAARRVTFVDVTAISRQAATRPAELIAPDGLHPSPAMHEAWAQVIAPAARRALEGKPATRAAPERGD